MLAQDPYTSYICDDDPACAYYPCDSGHACNSATTSVGTYKCYPYQGESGLSFFWLLSRRAEGGGGWDIECSDGYDNDCDDYTDCEDSDCAGKEGCCRIDQDCIDQGITCDAKGYLNRYAECTNNKCEDCDPCEEPGHCKSGCCESLINEDCKRGL